MQQLSALRGDLRLNDAGSTGNVIAKAVKVMGINVSAKNFERQSCDGEECFVFSPE